MRLVLPALNLVIAVSVASAVLHLAWLFSVCPPPGSCTADGVFNPLGGIATMLRLFLGAVTERSVFAFVLGLHILAPLLWVIQAAGLVAKTVRQDTRSHNVESR